MKKCLYAVLLISIFVLCCACGDGSNYLDLSDDAYNMSESEHKNECKRIKYDDFRYEADYMEKQTKVKCKGEVTEICREEDSDSEYFSEYRISITKEDYGYGNCSYTDDIYVFYILDKNPKLLEGDIVTLYGEVTKAVTYTTVQNAERTIPAMVAVYVDIE